MCMKITLDTTQHCKFDVAVSMTYKRKQYPNYQETQVNNVCRDLADGKYIKSKCKKLKP